MELERFSSTAEFWGEAIDCRQLILTAGFYSLTANNVIAMVSDMIEWLSQQLSGRFWVRRCVAQRSIRRDQVVSRIQDELHLHNFVVYTEEAMAVSPVVYNLKTYQKYMRNNYIYGSPTLKSNLSVDYPKFWETLWKEKEKSQDEILRNILSIFREEGRKHVGGYNLPDVSTSINILPYRNQPSWYYGTINIRFSAFGLNYQLDEMADKLKEFAKHLAQAYKNANIQVALQPPSAHKNSYMQLFGEHSYTDGSHINANCQKTEWYPTYYLPSVEWYNSLSSLAQQHLSAVYKRSSEVYSEEFLEGTLIVKSTKPISKFDITDALEMKKRLYPALCPGESSISLRTLFPEVLHEERMTVFPRSTWAIVPVFEEEIDIISNYLVFTSRSLLVDHH